MARLDRHPDIAWPPAFGGSYAGAQPLMADLGGTLLRVEPVRTVGPAPQQIRLVAEYEGHEWSGILECQKPELFAELRAKLAERIARPLRELGDIDLPVDPMWHVTVQAIGPMKWPDDDTTFRLRTDHRIYVKRHELDERITVATAHIDAPTATDAARAVYWKLRDESLLPTDSSSSALLSATATDPDGKPVNVVMEAVVRPFDRKES